VIAKYKIPLILSVATSALTYFVVDYTQPDNSIMIIGVPIASFVAWLLLLSSDKSVSGRGGLFDCTVVSVHDGDTLELDYHGRVQKYRVLYIDAPELKQRGGEEATTALRLILEGKFVQFEIPDKGAKSTYDRVLCKIYANGKDVGHQMVSSGNAWIDTRYNTPPEYIRSFANAVKKKVGIFKKGFPVHPSIYRKNK
jgi:endonuclease YncB( thermonuclease family)